MIGNRRTTSRIVTSTSSALVVVGASWLAGCGPEGVGSAPSSKAQVSEFLSKESEKDQLTKQGKLGKNIQGPKNIKSRLIKADTKPE